jgi:hypothetical protein
MQYSPLKYRLQYRLLTYNEQYNPAVTWQTLLLLQAALKHSESQPQRSLAQHTAKPLPVMITHLGYTWKNRQHPVGCSGPRSPTPDC